MSVTTARRPDASRKTDDPSEGDERFEDLEHLRMDVVNASILDPEAVHPGTL